MKTLKNTQKKNTEALKMERRGRAKDYEIFKDSTEFDHNYNHFVLNGQEYK